MFVLSFAAGILLLYAFFPTPALDPEPRPGTDPDTLIEWGSYDVSDLILVNPTEEDSIGGYPMRMIPRGSFLSIPRRVPPDTTVSFEAQP
jgi:hypothetical protein